MDTILRPSNFLLSFLLLGLAACGGSGNSDKGPAPSEDKGVRWQAVSSEFNPTIEEMELETSEVERIELSLFGSADDVVVKYSKRLPEDGGLLRIYKVWKDSVSWGQLQARQDEETLSLANSGTYQCSIQVKNGRITALEGGCHVRIEVVLPGGREIEVYGEGRLLSKRFFPLSSPAFLEAFDDATWADDKFAVIADYLKSYKETGKRPKLLAAELGEVIGDFSWAEEKFKALRKLHRHVTDRENLGAMIDEEFGFFDREKARDIAGI